MATTDYKTDVDPRWQGLAARRYARFPVEERFARAWQQANESDERPGELLDYILSRGDGDDPLPATENERLVANTLIQWLGTPLGMMFLERVTNKRLF